MTGSMFGFSGAFNEPGLSDVTRTVEQDIMWGDPRMVLRQSFRISGAARDAGNTPTTVLRPGLLMGIIASSGLASQYDGTHTDGTEKMIAIVEHACRVVDIDGNNQNLYIDLIVGGPVKASKLFGLDLLARAQMRGRFFMDDESPRQSAFPYMRQIAKTADYVVVAPDDIDTLFTTQGAIGAVKFTLPSPTAALKGFRVAFFNEVDQTLTVDCATNDSIVTFNDAAADSVAFSTGGEKIGAFVEFVVNVDGTKWLCLPRLSGHTLTVAT